MPTIRQAIRTTTVPWTSCCWPGHSTFLSSPQDSRTKPPPGSWRGAPSARAGSTAGRTGVRERVLRSTACLLSACAARRALRSERVWRAIGLASLPVHSVAAAPAAVLLELDPVGRVPLRLLGLVVAPLAFGAGERDPNSDSGCHFSFSCSEYARSSGGGGRTSDTPVISPLLLP